MKCKKCGADISNEAKFCTGCGEPVELAKAAQEVKEEVAEKAEEVKEEVAEKVAEVIEQHLIGGDVVTKYTISTELK